MHCANCGHNDVELFRVFEDTTKQRFTRYCGICVLKWTRNEIEPTGYPDAAPGR